MSDPAANTDHEHASDDRRRAVAAFEHEDPELTPAERETLFRFSRADDRVEFYTAERGVGRRLLAHPAASIGEVTLRRGDRRRPAVPLEEVEEGDEVVAVRGALPIEALKVHHKTRTDGGHAAIVSDRVLQTEGGEP